MISVSRYKLFVALFFITVSVQALADDEFLESLRVSEGMYSTSVKNLDLQNVVDALVQKIADAPTPAQLERQYKAASNQSDRDVFFVLYVISASINGQQTEAFSRWSKLDPPLNKTYVDYDPEDKSEVMQAAYNWLVNNTNFVVPTSMVRVYPELIHRTPYWGATRDAYFKVDVSKKGHEQIIQSQAQTRFHDALLSALNPGNCFMGSMVNARHKRRIINLSILIESPEYYIANIMPTSFDEPYGNPWIDHWSKMSPVEQELNEELITSQEELVDTIIKYLMTEHDLEKKIATKAARTYTNEQIRNLTGVSKKYEQRHQEIREAINSNDLSIITQMQEPHDQSVVAGLMLAEGQDDLVLEYYIALLSKASFSAADELIELAAATDRTKLLNNLIRTGSYNHSLNRSDSEHSGFERFGKTPLMYAAQHNQIKNYLLLRKQMPELINYVLPSTNYSCGPTIRGRSLLTYALEGASRDLIKNVLFDVSESLLVQSDTAGRNIFAYLANNEKLTDVEVVNVRDEVFELLGLHDLLDTFPFQTASFSCRDAKTRVELMTCSSQKFAQLDQQLTRSYNAARSEDHLANEVLKSQRAWLRTRSECIFQNGFEVCYKSRISKLNAFLSM